MPNFETFTKRMAPLARAPYVTIQRRGTVSLNKAAHLALGEAEAVELLYDKQARIVGLRGVPLSSPHAYALRGAGGKEDGATTFLFSGTAFVKFYGIDTSESRRWEAELVDDILCVSLDSEATLVTGNRSSKTVDGYADGVLSDAPGEPEPRDDIQPRIGGQSQARNFVLRMCCDHGGA